MTQRHSSHLSPPPPPCRSRFRDQLVIAATSGSEPIATGDVLEGSDLGGSQFCAGGIILDTHASLDPAVEPLGLIDRRFTCSEGTMRMVLTPDLATQTGVWTVVSGTGAYEGLRGSGQMEIKYGPEADSPAQETLTGTVTR